MSPPTWDDDFDFDDIDDQPKTKKKPAQVKKANVYDDDDFFDDQPKQKLPSISSNKNVSSHDIGSKRNSAKYNPYTQNMNLKGNDYQDLYEEQIDEQPLNNKSKQMNNKQNQVEQQFYEDIDDIPVQNQKVDKPKAQQKEKEPSADNDDQYGEDFDDAYGEDFEEVQLEEPAQLKTTESKKPQPVIKTQQPKKKSLNLPGQNRKQPPKRPSSKQKVEPKRNMTSIKNQKPALQRQNSHKSIKSVNSQRQRATSKSRPPLNNKLATNNSFIPQKYTNQVRNAFPEQSVETLKALPQQKMSKMNDRVRAMIKRFNEELNNLINRNMLHLKTKKNEKVVTVEDRLRVYEEQKKNNETMIEYMEKQFDKLCGREGQLREEEYQLMTEKKIEETKELIKQTQKNITKLKYEVKNEGNKLSKKGEDKRLAQQLHHLKTLLIQGKKDEEKHEQKIGKLEEQSYDLDSKIADVDNKISQCVQKAQEKGIKLETNDELTKKYEDIRKKIQISRNHRGKLQNLLKTKSDIISHEKQQLRINIKNSELEIKNLYESISHAHQESVKVVQKAKTNPRVTPTLSSHLEEILHSLEQAQIDTLSIRSQSNKSQASERPTKPNNLASINKTQNMKKQAQEKQDDPNKPNLMKKKPKMNEFPIQQKQKNTKVWKDDEQKESVPAPPPKQEKKPDEEADKKKPFSLRRNRLSSQNKNNNSIQLQPKIEEKNEGGLKLDMPDKNAPPKTEEQKKEQAPSLGPRMMKFRRKMNQNADQNNTSKNGTSKQLQPQKQKAQQKPSIYLTTNEQPNKQQNKPFVPKRFNLRNKLQEKKDDSYVPSIEKKEEEPKKDEIINKEPEKSKETNDLKFNFNDVEDPYANKKKQNKVQPDNNKASEKKITIPGLGQQQQEIKPRFNLRLRDRKKNNDTSNNDDGYMPSGASQKNLGIQEKNQPVNNPYAPNKIQKNEPANNPYAPKNVEKPKEENAYNPYAPANAQKQKPKQEANPYNPYAQNQNAQAPRRREGPIKKTKPQINAPKQKINIYQQAEEVQGINQFVTNSPPKNQQTDPYQPNYKQTQKQPDLNDLLGLNNKKNNNNNDDLADLLGGPTKTKKTTKNRNQFFGDMDF